MTSVRQKSYCYSSGDSSSSREKSLVLFSPDATRGSIKSKGKIRKSRAQQTETDEEESSEQDHSPVDLPEQAHGSPIKNCGSYCSFQSPGFEKSIETSNNKRFPSRSGKRGADGSRNCLLSCDQSNSLALDLRRTKSHSKSGTLFSQESPQQFVIDDDEEKSLAQNVSSFVVLAQTISSPIESPRPYRHFNSTGFQKSKDNNNNKRQSSRSSKYDADRRHVRSSPCAHSPKTHDRANTQHEMRKSKARFSKMASDEVEERSTQNDSPLVVHTNCNAVEHSGSFRRTQSSGCYTKKENHCFQSSGRKINTVNLTNDKLPSKSSKRGADNRCTRFTSSEKSQHLMKTLRSAKSQSRMRAWRVQFSTDSPQQQIFNDEEDSLTQDASQTNNSQLESSWSKNGRPTQFTSSEKSKPLIKTLARTKSQSKMDAWKVLFSPETPQQQLVNDEEDSTTREASLAVVRTQTNHNSQIESSRSKIGGETRFTSCEQHNPVPNTLGNTKSQSKTQKSRVMSSPKSPQQQIVNDEEESPTQDPSPVAPLAKSNKSQIESSRSKNGRRTRLISSKNSRPFTTPVASTKSQSKVDAWKVLFSPETPQQQLVNDEEDSTTQDTSPAVLRAQTNHNSQIESSRSKIGRQTRFTSCEQPNPVPNMLGSTKSQSKLQKSRVMSSPESPQQQIVNDEEESPTQDPTPVAPLAKSNNSQIESRSKNGRRSRFTSSKNSRPFTTAVGSAKSQSKMDAWKVLFSPETPQQQLVNDEEDSTTQDTSPAVLRAQTNHNSQIESSRSKIGRQTRFTSCEQPNPVPNMLGSTKSQSKLQKSRVMSSPESPQQQIVNDEEESPTEDPTPVAPLAKSNNSQIESRSKNGRRSRFTSSKNSGPFTTAVVSTKSQSKMDAWKVLFSPETPPQQLVNDEEDSTTQDTSPAVFRAQTNHSRIESSRSNNSRRTRFTCCEQPNPVPKTLGSTTSKSRIPKSRVPESPQQHLVNNEGDSTEQDPSPVAPLPQTNNSQIENSCSKSPTFEKWEETVAKRTSSRSGENNTENKCSSDKAQSSPIRTLAESMGHLSISHVQNFPTSQSPIPSNDSSPIYAGSPDSSSCESLAEVSTTDNIENNYSITPTNLLRNGKSNQVSYAELSKKTSSGTRHSGHPLQQLNHNIGLKKGATFYYQPLQTEIRCQKVESPSSFPDPLKRFPKSTRSRLITIHKRIVSLHRQEPRSSIVFSLTKDQIIFLTLKILLNKGPLETSNSNSPTDRIFGHTLVVVRDKSWIDPYCQALREGSSLSVLDHPSLLLRERKSTSNTERFSKYGVVLTTFDVLKSTETTLPLNETGEFILPAAASSSTQGQWYSSRNGSQPVASPPLAQCSVLHRILWTRVILVDAIGRKSYLAKPDTSRFIASKNLCSNGRLLFFPCPDEEDNQHRDTGLNRLLKSDKRAHVAIGSLLRLPEPQHNEGNLRDNAIDAEDIC